MFALISKDNGLPTVVSQNSETFPSFIMAGYDIIAEGTKKEMNEVYEEMICEFANNQD